MAGFTIVTNQPGEAALSTAGKTAEQLGFNVRRVSDWELNADKGSMALSILFGAFVAYCNFKLRVETNQDRTITIVLERNTPWWTGIIGVNRIKSRAEELANSIAANLHAQGAAVLHQGSF